MEKMTIITLDRLVDLLEGVEDFLVELGMSENEKLDRDIGDTLIYFAEQLGNEIILPLKALLDEERIKN